MHPCSSLCHRQHKIFLSFSVFQCPVIPSPFPSISLSPSNCISRVYNPNVINVFIHRHVRKPPHVPFPPRSQVQESSADAGVNVDNKRLVYVAMRMMGEYTMKTFISLED